MKIALISDIHSNVFALEAVLEDIKKHNVDTIVNLGDILYGAIAPKDTYELLMKYDCITICGNQDRQIYEATKDEIQSNSTMKFIIEDLGIEPINWLKTLPFDKQLTDNIYLCHGTPSDDLVYLLEDITSGSPILKNNKDIIKLLNNQKSKLICCGHTHIQRDITLSTKQIIVNPGSVGLQAYTDEEPILHSMENFTSDASYSIIEVINDDYHIQHKKVPYDVQLAVKKAKENGRDDWVHFLNTGEKL